MGLFKKKPADEQAEEQSASAATPSAAGRKTWRPTFSFGRKKGPAGETPSGTRESEEKPRRGSGDSLGSEEYDPDASSPGGGESPGGESGYTGGESPGGETGYTEDRTEDQVRSPIANEQFDSVS